MTAYNVVRFRVKPGRDREFIDLHRKAPVDFKGWRNGALVKTGDQAYCFVGEWDNFNSIVAARPGMIGMLDSFRDMLEDLGNGLGITDPISGETVLQLGNSPEGQEAREAEGQEKGQEGRRQSRTQTGEEGQVKPQESREAPEKVRRSSSALWSLLRADGASGRSHRCVQRHGGANERLQRLFIDLVALMEIDGAPGVAFEAGVEEARRVLQRGALGEGQLHDALVRLAGADDSGVLPHRNASRVRRLSPFHLLDHFGVGLLDEARTRASVSPRQSLSSLILASIS